MNRELPNVQARFRQGRGTRNEIANIWWIIGKARKFQKNLLLYWLHYSLWMCGSQQTGKSLKRWEYQTTLPVSWETCMQIKKQQLELDMEQQTGSKLGKLYVKVVYYHSAYLTFMQSTSCEMTGWMNPKLESELLGQISATPDIQLMLLFSCSIVSTSLWPNELQHTTLPCPPTSPFLMC